MRIRLFAVLVAAPVLFLSAPASAHVNVHSPEAAEGGFAKLTFKVPNEKDIPTTKLEINLPADQPMAFVSVKPHPGWRVAVTKAKLATPITARGRKITEAVRRIVWTAQAGQSLQPGQFDEFDISAGYLPMAPTMTFKALQTYSDGTVVRWVEVGEDADHPAPVLKLKPALPTRTTVALAADATGTSDSTATVLGGAGLAAGALGLLLGGLAFARTRRS